MKKQLEYVDSILRSDPLKAYELVTEFKNDIEDEELMIDARILEVRALIVMSRVSEAVVRPIRYLSNKSVAKNVFTF